MSEGLMGLLAEIPAREDVIDAMAAAVVVGQFLAFAQQQDAWMMRRPVVGPPIPWTTDELRELRIAFIRQLFATPPAGT